LTGRGVFGASPGPAPSRPLLAVERSGVSRGPARVPFEGEFCVVNSDNKGRRTAPTLLRKKPGAAFYYRPFSATQPSRRERLFLPPQETLPAGSRIGRVGQIREEGIVEPTPHLGRGRIRLGKAHAFEQNMADCRSRIRVESNLPVGLFDKHFHPVCTVYLTAKEPIAMPAFVLFGKVNEISAVSSIAV